VWNKKAQNLKQLSKHHNRLKPCKPSPSLLQ
jgi:hypothetical protein